METLERFQEMARNGMETFLIFGYGLETFQWHFQAVSPQFKFPKRGTKFPLPFLEVSGNLGSSLVAQGIPSIPCY